MLSPQDEEFLDGVKKASYGPKIADLWHKNDIQNLLRIVEELKKELKSESDHADRAQDAYLIMCEKAKSIDKERDGLREMADKLINHCDKEGGECSECSEIVCPDKCKLHFHHDGCPICSFKS